MAQINLITTKLNLQSEYLYCQAVGCSGYEQRHQIVGSKEGERRNNQTEYKNLAGALIRWAFLKELGENHLPKADLVNGKVPRIGFNKSDDYVYIYKAKYEKIQRISFNLHSAPSLLINKTDYIEWKYNLGSNKLLLRFRDIPKYNSLNLNYDILTQTYEFLRNYDSIIEIELENKLSYAVSFSDIVIENPTGLSVELINIKDKADDTTTSIFCRKYFKELNKKYNDWEQYCENIKLLRIKQKQSLPKLIEFEIYSDFFDYAQFNSKWEYIGNFGLSITDSVVMNRLQRNGAIIHDVWKKFNDTANVNINNYISKWNSGSDSLKDAINTYLSLSNNDLKANKYLESSSPDNNGITISYLDMLRLVSLDYHVARMLGLGWIDLFTRESVHNKYVYASVYVTNKSIGEYKDPTNHIYMTLPTGIDDQRLPIPPIQLPVSYGLFVNNGVGNTPIMLSDAQGYSKFEDIRYIDINKKNKSTPQQIIPDISEKDEFCACQITQPVSSGIEIMYPGDTNWNTKELSHDPDYLDTVGIPEVVPVLEKENPIYVHEAELQGNYKYAVYNIDIFSRASSLSNPETASVGPFPIRQTILPPSYLGVQFVQEEDPLIFTTQNEQDNYLNKLRVTYIWNHIHNERYHYKINNNVYFADTVEFFFRKDAPSIVKGKIKSIISISEDMSELRTEGYQDYSSNDNGTIPTIFPTINTTDFWKYIGSFLSTNSGQFEIISLQQSSNSNEGPIIRVRNLKQQTAYQSNNNAPYILTSNFISPANNELFFFIENLSNENSWNKLTKKFPIKKFSEYSEWVNFNGVNKLAHFGGITGNASFVQSSMGNDYWEVTITPDANTILNPLVDPPDNIIPSEWYKGTIRIPINSDPNIKKTLEVLRIIDKNPIKVLIQDPDTNSSNLSSQFALQTTFSPFVNFHPGVRLYLDYENPNFNDIKLLPELNEYSNQTYFCVRAIDSTKSPVITSPLSQAVTILTRKIENPVAPEDMIGPQYTTRPDVNGISTFTIDVKLDVSNSRKPYGFILYKTNQMSILQTLYDLVTIENSIIPGLKSIEIDPNISITDKRNIIATMWNNLVNCIIDSSDNSHFQGTDGHFKFPVPVGVPTVEIVKSKINGIFIPVTEKPILIDLINSGNQTSLEKPSENNPFPMAVMLDSATVRVTDSLDGNASNIYFYFAREIALDMKLSGRTPIIGPVYLVNSTPPEIPQVRSVLSQLQNPIEQIPTAVKFEVSNYLESENVLAFQIYRTLNSEDTVSVRNMKPLGIIETSDMEISTNSNDLILKDEFSDLTFPPYGQPIYYRLVSYRKIFNEYSDEEYIPSKPSSVMIANVVDNINPDAPEITFSPSLNGSRPNIIDNVELLWNKTAYNAKYYLYKMNNYGNWFKIYDILQSDYDIDSFSPILINLSSTQLGSGSLILQDDEGNNIYHRFKVMVEGPNGLLNLNEKILTI